MSVLQEVVLIETSSRARAGHQATYVVQPISLAPAPKPLAATTRRNTLDNVGRAIAASAPTERSDMSSFAARFAGRGYGRQIGTKSSSLWLGMAGSLLGAGRLGEYNNRLNLRLRLSGVR